MRVKIIERMQKYTQSNVGPETNPVVVVVAVVWREGEAIRQKGRLGVRTV
jgi:hypothetical protein